MSRQSRQTGTIGTICDKDATNLKQRANWLIRVGSTQTLPIRLRYLCNSLLHDYGGDTFTKEMRRRCRDTVATIGDAALRPSFVLRPATDARIELGSDGLPTRFRVLQADSDAGSHLTDSG